MNIKSFSTNFRAGCAGLTAALMLLSSTSAYAQTNQSNGSTKVLPIQQGGAAGGLGQAGGNINAAIQQSGGAGSTQAAAVVSAIQTAAGGGAGAVSALTTSLINAGVAPGLAANLAVVTTLTPATVNAILAGRRPQSSLPTPRAGSAVAASLSSSTGTLVASSEPMFVAQTSVTPVQNTEAAVTEAYDALTQAFIAGGVSPTNAQSNAANMLIALASVKYAAPVGGGVNVGQINRIATLIQPAIADLPGLRKAITDNPNLSLATFRQIQATIGILEPMALLVRVVNENV